MILFAVKPNCTIARKEINDEDTLVCTAIGNPTEVNLKHLPKYTYEIEINLRDSCQENRLTLNTT